MEASPTKRQNPRILKVLEALKQASNDLRSHPSCPDDSDDSSSSAIKALLELETESDNILSSDPNLYALSALLARLKTHVETLQKSRARHGLGPFVTRRVSTHSISRVAESIGSEIQAWIDRETVECLVRSLRDKPISEDELTNLLTQFEDRVSEGFDRELQDLVLKSKVFALLESTLRDPSGSKRVREHCAHLIGALIRFNKDVFVGQVLMGPTVKALITMSTTCSMKVLCSLVRSIKSPLVDEIRSNGEIPRIASLLKHRDPEMRVLALDCVLEIGYFGRKEAVDAMLEEGLVERLVELQGSNDDDESGGDSDEVCVGGVSERGCLESKAFASCVARFSVSLEVGEGLRQREKRALKQEVLAKVRLACGSQAEAATILAEVLWGSSP